MMGDEYSPTGPNGWWRHVAHNTVHTRARGGERESFNRRMKQMNMKELG